MEVTVKRPTKIDVRFIAVNTHVRYWEDGEYGTDPNNFGDDDPDQPNMPCVHWDDSHQEYRWCPLIAIDEGKIMNWPEHVGARIHYKVCDEFYCDFWDEDAEPIDGLEYEGYVPEFMCPEDNGYGDYIIMTICGGGKIADWDKEEVRKFLEKIHNIND